MKCATLTVGAPGGFLIATFTTFARHAGAIACALLLSFTLAAIAKPPPLATLSPLFPDQGADASKPATLTLTLESKSAGPGTLTFSAVRYQDNGAAPTRSIALRSPGRVAPGESKDVAVTVTQEGVYEVIAAFDSDPEHSCAVVVIVVSHQGKLWFGRDNLMNVAAARAAAETTGARSGARAPAAGAARAAELHREMSALYK